MNALFVGSIIFYVLATFCGFVIWAYSCFRTRLLFAYVFLASYALALPFFIMHLVLTLDPKIVFVLLGPHGPQLWEIGRASCRERVLVWVGACYVEENSADEWK